MRRKTKKESPKKQTKASGKSTKIVQKVFHFEQIRKSEDLVDLASKDCSFQIEKASQAAFFSASFRRLFSSFRRSLGCSPEICSQLPNAAPASSSSYVNLTLRARDVESTYGPAGRILKKAEGPILHLRSFNGFTILCFPMFLLCVTMFFTMFYCVFNGF